MSVLLSVALIAAVTAMYFILNFVRGKRQQSTVPGLKPSSKEKGNLDDIDKTGSLHEFLMGLHKDFGPIASFWWGTQYTVSISSAELFRQHQQHFDRPPELFRMLKFLVTRHSIQYANGADGKSRRQAYDKAFSHDNLATYFDKLQTVAIKITSTWDHAEADHQLPLGKQMYLFSAKAALNCLMGDKVKDDKETMAFEQAYHVVKDDLEQLVTNPHLHKENSIRAGNFQKAVDSLRGIISDAIKERESGGKENNDFLLIDAIIGHHSGDEERRYADAISFAVAGLHTTSNLITWCIYFMCIHDDVQERVYQEILDVLGPTDPVTHQSIGQLKYLRQVLDETLRCAVVAPWAARFADVDTEIGGHKIPAGTPVIHALGVSLMDEKFWPTPTVFDPDRFSEERSKGRPNIAFSPFGFAGRRQCPAYSLAYVEASIMLVTAIQKFKLLLVPGQNVKQYGLVTHPREEIWFTVIKRE